MWWSSLLEHCPEGKKERPKKKDRPKKEKKEKRKKKEKEKGKLPLSFSTLVLQRSTIFFMIESLMLSNFHMLVGIFIIELGLYIPMMGFLKCPRSSWASKLDAHPLSFQFELSYTYSSSASVAWQSLLLALTSIDGHLHSPLISRVNVRLSPFCLLHTTSIIIFYSTHSAMWMACAHVLREGWKGWSALKSMNQLLGLSSGLCMIWMLSVVKMEHSQTIWFCRDELSLAMLFW